MALRVRTWLPQAMPDIAATSVPSANDQTDPGCRASRVPNHLHRWKPQPQDQSGPAAWQPSSAPLPALPSGALLWARSGGQTSPERPAEYSGSAARAVPLLALQTEFHDGEKLPAPSPARKPADHGNF